MKTILGVKMPEAIAFVGIAALYIAFQMFWSLMVANNPGAVLGFLASMNPQVANNYVLLLVCTLASVGFAVVGSVLGKGEEKPVAQALIRFGLAYSVYSCAAQIAVVSLANWTLPTEGIPVMHTATLAVFIGIVVAGIGSNLIWSGEKRAAFLAETATKKR